MYAGIYSIKCEINNKVYVGQSTNIFERWRNHIGRLENNKHSCKELQEDYNKYGMQNFTYSILEHVNWDEADKDNKELQELLLYKESYHGQRLNADKIGKGYNSGFSHETRDYKNLTICPEIEKTIRKIKPKEQELYLDLYKMFLNSYQEQIGLVHVTSFIKMARALGVSNYKVKSIVNILIKHDVIEPVLAEYEDSICRTTLYHIKEEEKNFQKAKNNS